jgi:chromosome segregation ATPase
MASEGLINGLPVPFTSSPDPIFEVSEDGLLTFFPSRNLGLTAEENHLRDRALLLEEAAKLATALHTTKRALAATQSELQDCCAALEAVRIQANDREEDLHKRIRRMGIDLDIATDANRRSYEDFRRHKAEIAQLRGELETLRAAQ